MSGYDIIPLDTLKCIGELCMKRFAEWMTGKTGKELANYAQVESWERFVNIVRGMSGIGFILCLIMLIFSYFKVVDIKKWALYLIIIGCAIVFILTFF